MKKIRWSLVALILIAPLSIGCEGPKTEAVGSQDDVAAFVSENPDSGTELEDTGGDADPEN